MDGFELPALVFELNAEGRLVYGSEQLGQVLEGEGGDLEGQPFQWALAKDQRPAFDALWSKVRAGETVRDAEFRLRPVQGLSRPVWISLFPLRDPPGARGIMGDLSGQKDLAYALEAAEERFSVLFRESSDPIFILSMEGEILLVNPSFEQLTGVRSDELFSGKKGWEDFVLAEDVAALRRALRECARSQQDGTAEYRLRTAGGGTAWFEQSHSILHDEYNRPRGIMAVARNIHRHKQHEVELREQAEGLQRRHDRAQELIARLKHFFTQTGVLAAERENFLRGVCDVLYEMYKPVLVTLSLAEGESFYRVRPDVLEAVGDKAIESLRCGVCGQIADSGMPFYTNTLQDKPPAGCGARLKGVALKVCLGAPLRDATGRIRGSLVLLDDQVRAFDNLDVELVTVAALQAAARLRAEEQDQLQEELEEHLRQAQKMEAVGMLAGGIAHDFNNILSSILGFTSYLIAKSDPGSTLRRDLGLIEQSAVRAADLTRQLLAFARRRHFAKEPVSFNTVIEDVLGILKRSLPANIAIRTQLASDLPRVMGDPGQINQVIMNLCLNAAEAMSGTGGALSLATEHRPLNEHERTVFAAQAPDTPPAERYVCISVADTGIGIRPEDQARIFDPFYTTKSARGGTGLGLSIVYGIVSNHQGHIHLESAAGKGTIFRLYFPACDALDEKRADTGPVPVPGGTETVLVVDDEPLVRQMETEVLKSFGYKVLSVSSGEQAVELVRELDGRVNLVLLDLVMPGMDGRQTFDALREIAPNLPVLLTSGFVREEMSDQLLSLGALGIIHKPCKSDALALAVRRALDRAARESKE